MQASVTSTGGAKPGWLRAIATQVAVLLAAPALAAYAAYAVVHPADAVRGIVDVITYRPHRAGLGTALLFPLPAGPITAINIAVLLLGDGVS